MISTAIILAGGLGTRLKGVVRGVPKPMAPIRGRPFLEYQMDYWIDQGISRFILSVGYLNELITTAGRSFTVTAVSRILSHPPDETRVS